MKKPIQVTVQEFSHIMEEGMDKFFLLDVREPDELYLAAIEGAVNIPLGEISASIDKIPDNIPVYTLCHMGVRSLKAAFYLREQGLDAYSIKGGIDAWAKEINSHVGFY
jgi:rhodanese-related sulfurtransferase